MQKTRGDKHEDEVEWRLLWCYSIKDNSDHETRIRDAIKAYKRRLKKEPNIVLVSLDIDDDELKRLNDLFDIEILRDIMCLPSHYQVYKSHE